MTKILRITGVCLLVVMLTACGSDAPDVDAAGDGQDHSQDHGAAGTVPGSPADPGDATREIAVEASDNLRFDPASIEVEAGEVVTFVVTNKGKTDHEFVLGDQADQEEHAADMAGGDHSMEMPGAVLVPPGKTKTVTWRFDESGEVLYGCHVNGHYRGGMVGRVMVT